MFIPSDLIKTPNFDDSTPNTYSYITATDTLDQVSAPFYFAGSDIRPNDVISVRSIDGEMTFTANGLTAMPSVADVTASKAETDRLKEAKPPATAQTIADAVTLAESGYMAVGGIVVVVDTGASRQLIDAGSSVARPAESELIKHVSGGSGGLYLGVTKWSFNPFVFQATSIGNCLMTGIAISSSELNIYLDSDIYKEVTTVTLSAGSTLSIGTIAGPSTANTGKTAMIVNSRTTGKKIYLKMTGLSGLTANSVYEVRAEQANTKITLS